MTSAYLINYLGSFEGVVGTETGYANGDLADPTYEQVYTDRTGHVECVKVSYDDGIISLATLCRLFFRSINPLSINRQGAIHTRTVPCHVGTTGLSRIHTDAHPTRPVQRHNETC